MTEQLSFWLLLKHNGMSSTKMFLEELITIQQTDKLRSF